MLGLCSGEFCVLDSTDKHRYRRTFDTRPSLPSIGLLSGPSGFPSARLMTIIDFGLYQFGPRPQAPKDPGRLIYNRFRFSVYFAIHEATVLAVCSRDNAGVLRHIEFGRVSKRVYDFRQRLWVIPFKIQIYQPGFQCAIDMCV